eukprot:gene27126-2355_t
MLLPRPRMHAWVTARASSANHLPAHRSQQWRHGFSYQGISHANSLLLQPDLKSINQHRQQHVGPGMLRSPHLVVLCKTGKRRPLIKQRGPLTAIERRKQRNQDLDKRLLLPPPNDPAFSGRLMHDINRANGPVQLSKLVTNVGAYMEPQHLAATLSRLAGLGAAAAGEIPPKSAELIESSTNSAAKLLLPFAGSLALDPTRCAQATLALEVITYVVAGSQDRLNLFPPEALAGMVEGLAVMGHQPPKEWMEKVCLESYARLSSFNAPELATISFSLVRLGHRPSSTWLGAVQRRFRETYGTSCNAHALSKFLFSLVKLGAKPTFNWMTAFDGEARRKIDAMTPRELATVLWACAFLKHPPDALLMEAWYRCAARAMVSGQGGGFFDATSVLLALQALVIVRVLSGRADAVAPAKFVPITLPRVKIQQLARDMSPNQLGLVLWALTQVELTPPKEWLSLLQSKVGGATSDAELAASPASTAWDIDDPEVRSLLDQFSAAYVNQIRESGKEEDTVGLSSWYSTTPSANSEMLQEEDGSQWDGGRQGEEAPQNATVHHRRQGEAEGPVQGPRKGQVQEGPRGRPTRRWVGARQRSQEQYSSLSKGRLAQEWQRQEGSV